MPYYKFTKGDILHNTIETNPEYTFDVYGGRIYINNESAITGTFVANAGHIPTGHISLYELNIDRNAGAHSWNSHLKTGTKSLIYPFFQKDSSLGSIGTITDADFNTSYQYGDEISSTYMLSSSISRQNFAEGTARSRIVALKNILNYYKKNSNHYAYETDVGGWDKDEQNLTLVSIPSIFFGSSIKKGSVDLKFYISGSLIARLRDENENGELLQTTGSIYAQSQGADSVAGVVLYNEGFVLLTGSWDLSPASYDFGPGGATTPRWTHFAAGANDGLDVTGDSLTTSASFNISFKGVNPVSTLTMFAHAPKGLLNHSNNSSFADYVSASVMAATNSLGYFEHNERPIKNTVSSSFCDYSASFEKQTFISKIGIYDENKNLIAVANLARPVKKLENRDYTFKLKLDI
jgi:hypothetical protein